MDEEIVFPPDVAKPVCFLGLGFGKDAGTVPSGGVAKVCVT
jgi:hypothetical protein